MSHMKNHTLLKTIGPITALGMLILSGEFSGHAQNPVTFEIDMNAQSPSEVYVRGSFNGWATTWALTNNGSGIWSGTFDDTNAPGTVEACKFFYQPGDNWEADPNRQFVLENGGQILPLTAWNVKDWPTPTNDITFQVDMSAQILTGAFTNGDSVIRVSGVFNGWGAGDFMTNNPALTGSQSNIFSAVVPVTGFPNSTIDGYKFRANGGWESPASTGGNNRTFQLAGGNQVLPLVFYNDATPCDLLQLPTSVTFVLQITNGTPSAGDTIIFDSSINKLYLNGEFLGWWSWNTGFGGSEGPQYELTNNPVGSDLYQQTFTIPAGKSLNTIYKYSIDGFDNEAGFGVNHGRYVRTLSGVPYTMPVDRFGTNQGPLVVEQSFGNLAIGAPSGGTVPITWSGRQCVTLQTRPSLSGGIWTDIGATDGTSSTNWPVGSDAQFFRLRKAP
jgi:hypothetical protein